MDMLLVSVNFKMIGSSICCKEANTMDMILDKR